MSLPTTAIETAFITRYRADATLQGLMVGAIAPLWNIFDASGVPTNQAFPYIVVFPITEQIGADMAFGTDAVDSFIQVSVFTQPGISGGMKQARGIIKQIYALTHGKPLDLSASGFNQYNLLFDNKQEHTDGIVPQIDTRWSVQTQG